MSDATLYKTESHFQTWLKSISWRLLGTMTTFVVTFSITQSLNVATAVGTTEFCAKIILFYMHERIWLKINSFLSWKS